MAKPQSLEEFLAWEPNFPEAYLGHGLLYKGTKAIFYGKYKSLKSMLVQNLGICLTRGEQWLGFRVPENGVSVLYLQLEIPHALLRRRYLRMTHGCGDSRQRYWIWTEHFLKLDSSAGYEELRKQIRDLEPQVLIIDPIYKVISGDIKEQSNIQPLLDNLDRLIEEFGISIILVGHTKKSALGDGKGKEEWGSDDLIGSSIFSAWADSIVKIERGDGYLRLKFDVIRHAEEDIGNLEVNISKDLEFTTKPRI